MILKTVFNPKFNSCFLINSSTTKEKRPMTMYIKICRYLYNAKSKSFFNSELKSIIFFDRNKSSHRAFCQNAYVSNLYLFYPLILFSSN